MTHWTPETATAIVKAEEARRDAVIARANADAAVAQAGVQAACENAKVAKSEADMAASKADEAKYEHAVPAQEETKRSKEITKRLLTVGTGLGSVAMIIAGVKLNGWPLAETLTAIMATVGVAWGYVSHVEKKKPSPKDPTSPA